MPLGLQWSFKTEKSGASEIAELRAYRTPLSHRELIAWIGATYQFQARHQWILATYSAQCDRQPGLLANACTCSAHATPPLFAGMQAGFVWGSSVSRQTHKTQICDSGNSLGCFRWQHGAVSILPTDDKTVPTDCIIPSLCRVVRWQSTDSALQGHQLRDFRMTWGL